MPSRSSVMSAPGLGVWKWADLEIDDCCPFWGCPCGMHFQEASQMGLQHALRHAVRFLELGLHDEYPWRCRSLLGRGRDNVAFASNRCGTSSPGLILP